jgi:hypothetical protein
MKAGYPKLGTPVKEFSPMAFRTPLVKISKTALKDFSADAEYPLVGLGRKQKISFPFGLARGDRTDRPDRRIGGR